MQKSAFAFREIEIPFDCQNAGYLLHKQKTGILWKKPDTISAAWA